MPIDSTTRRDSRWTGLSAEARRAARRALLLDVAFDLLGSEGAAGTTVRAVCRRSDLNPRYFYESFEDLDSLVVAVYDRTVGQLASALETALGASAKGPRDQVRSVVEAIVSFVADDQRRARILYVEALGNEALNRRRIATGTALVSAVERAGTEHPGATGSGEHVSRMAAAMLVGGLSEMLIEWLEGRIPVEREQFIDDVTSLALAVGEAASAIAPLRNMGNAGDREPR